MNCATHTETEATGYCRSCGKPLCSACQHTAQGTLFCAEHAPAQSTTAEAAAGATGPQTPPPPPRPQEWSPYTAPTPPPLVVEGAPSPGLAFILGLIPGVGAIYNSQYVKGLVHVVVFGMIISILNSDAAPGFTPLFAFMIPAWVLYQAFEAYHTAKRRLYGYSVDEFSGLVPRRKSGFPAGPVLLMAIGVLFLLNTMDLLRISQVVRYWPLMLIALGGYLLYERLMPAGGNNEAEGPK